MQTIRNLLVATAMMLAAAFPAAAQQEFAAGPERATECPSRRDGP